MLKSFEYFSFNPETWVRVETQSGHPGHPGQLGHVLSRSSGSNLVYKLSSFNLGSHVYIMVSGHQSKELSVVEGDGGSISPDSPQYISRD